MSDQVPVHIQRFILTSIESVPHLEAILLLRSSPSDWPVGYIAQRLFIPEKRAIEILENLCRAGFVSRTAEDLFVYNPTSDQMREAVEELNRIYPRNVVAISKFIHAKTDKQAQSFGDAFRFRKD